MTQASGTDPQSPRASYTQFRLKMPAGAVGQTVAQSLALRGHRWVITGDGVVESLCVNPPPMQDEADEQWQDCEMAAVEALARAHGGYVGSASEGRGGEPERRFLRGSRTATIELDAHSALDRRRAAIATFPQRQPEPAAAPPFATAQPPQGGPGFLDTIRKVSQQVYGDPEAALRLAGPHGFNSGELPGSADEFLGALFDAVMHQDSCYPATADAIPLIATLATHDGLSETGRALTYGMLFSGASNGMRMIVLLADKLVAHGDGFELYEGARLTREAVAARISGLLERWECEPGSVRMMLAGLAAAFPRHAAASPALAGLAQFADRWPGTRRAAALRLALAAARADDAATLAEISAIQAWHWQGPLAGGSPLAPPQARALYLLDEMLDMN